MMQKKNIDSKLLYVFLAVPLFSSIMSAIHLISMVSLGNQMIMAISLAVTFELGSIVSFVAMGKNIMKRLKKELLYWVFSILFILQAFGNVYSSFDYIRKSLITDPAWLDSFREMFFNIMDVTTTKLTLAILIGLPIPIISLILLKAAVDYFSAEDEEQTVQRVNDEQPAVIPDEKHNDIKHEFENCFQAKPMGRPLPDIELLELANEQDRAAFRNIVNVENSMEKTIDDAEKSHDDVEIEHVVAFEPVNQVEVLPEKHVASDETYRIYEKAQQPVMSKEEFELIVHEVPREEPPLQSTEYDISKDVAIEPEKKN